MTSIPTFDETSTLRTVATAVANGDEQLRPELHRHYSVAPLLGGVESLSATYRAHVFTPHSQETAVIGVVEHGSAMVFGAGEVLTLDPGSVLVIPPRVLHDAYSIGRGAWHYKALYLTTPQIAAITADAVDGQGVLGTRPFVLDARGIAEQVLAAHQELRKPLLDNSVCLVDQLRQLIHALADGAARAMHEQTETRRVAAGVASVRRLLDDEPLERRSLKDMANVARVSPFTFAHAFKRAYGISPHAYALQRRVSAVRELLVAGELVSRAAHHVGFADQSHLTRRFISVVGVTPGEFRRAWQERRAEAPAHAT